MKTFAFIIYLLSLIPQTLVSQTTRGFARASSIEQDIEMKVQKTVEYLNELAVNKKNMKLINEAFKSYFTESGYLIIQKSAKTEIWIPFDLIAGKIANKSGIKYEFQAAKIIHFQDFKLNEEGKYIGKATVYDSVREFDAQNQPVASKVSSLIIPFDKKPPANDYWQIFEMKIKETKKYKSSSFEYAIQ